MMDSEANKVRFTAAWLKYLARGYDLQASWHYIGSGMWMLHDVNEVGRTEGPRAGRELAMIYSVASGFVGKVKGRRREYKTLRTALKAVNAQFFSDDWIGVT